MVLLDVSYCSRDTELILKGVGPVPEWGAVYGSVCRGGVLVPDPCLSGAAVFTVRKEAVSCVPTPHPSPPPSRRLLVQFVRTENQVSLNRLHGSKRAIARDVGPEPTPPPTARPLPSD